MSKDRHDAGVSSELEVVAKSVGLIESHGEYETAAQYLKMCRAMEKKIVEYFRPMKQAQDKAKRAILEREKEQLSAVREVTKRIESSMDEYDTAIEEQIEDYDGDIKEIAPPKVSGVSNRKLRKFQIVDDEKISPDFLIPDTTAIGKIVRAVGKQAEYIVGGIKVTEERSFTVRSDD